MRKGKRLNVPVFSEYDPEPLSEGTLDPLGLYLLADKLAVELVPGVRERQQHPLFLVPIAVGALVCQEFDDDTIASDGFSPPWQVFEWYVVEGIVRRGDKQSDLIGLPGRLKTEEALKAGSSLSAVRYLKTPTVFGYTGVYRLLARALDIIGSDNSLGQNGYELLKRWMADEGLPDFIESIGKSRNGSFSNKLFNAVKEGLKAGRTARSDTWDGWRLIYEHLRHTRKAEKESEFIAERIKKLSTFTNELYDYLLSGKGKDFWNNTRSEQKFHGYVIESCSEELRRLLKACMEYEQFSCLLMNAFNSAFRTMTVAGSRIGISDLASSPNIKDIAQKVPEMYRRVEDAFYHLNMNLSLDPNFSEFKKEYSSAEDFMHAILQHHEKTQKNKPPRGKNPWFDRFEADSVMVRSGYTIDTEEFFKDCDTEYLHMYRTNSLWSFAKDLKLLEA